MEDKDIIGKEFEFFKYDDIPNLKWNEDYAKYIGSRSVVIGPHSRYPHATMAEVYPTIGKKFTKHFPTDQIIEQLEKVEYENKSVDDILNDMKQLISTI